MNYLTDHYRNLARQEARALRLLYKAKGRYPTTQPVDLNEDIDLETPICPQPSHSTLYYHRKHGTKRCLSCQQFKAGLERDRVRNRRARTKSERATTNPS